MCSDEEPELQDDAMALLPVNMVAVVMQHLTTAEVISLYLVSKPWCRMLSCDEVWDALLRRDFGATTDSEALAAARARVSAAAVAATAAAAAPPSTQGEPCQQEQQAPASGEQQQQQGGGRAQAVYRQLSALRACDRCQLEFREGCNGPSSCRFHPGVMFSGGALNGSGLSWTCCNRRSPGVAMLQRHADGCTQTRHVSGRASLWRPHLNGVVVQQLPAPSEAARCAGDEAVERAAPAAGQSSSSACGSSSRRASSVDEWHPDRLPGLEALPSRICMGNGQSMRVGF